MSKKAFQAVLESFERLANPEKFEEDDGDDDGKPAKKRQKTERFHALGRKSEVHKLFCIECLHFLLNC